MGAWLRIGGPTLVYITKLGPSCPSLQGNFSSNKKRLIPNKVW